MGRIKSIAEIKLDQEHEKLNVEWGIQLNYLDELHNKLCIKSYNDIYTEERCNKIRSKINENRDKIYADGTLIYEKYLADVKLVRLKNNLRVVFNNVIQIDSLNKILTFV